MLAFVCVHTHRSKPGVSARDLKQSVELLKFAAGLVPASDIKQQHHASTSAGNSQQQKGQQAGSTRAKQPLPVPGFPDLAFNVTGRADALRELALAYQVCVCVLACFCSVVYENRALQLVDRQVVPAMLQSVCRAFKCTPLTVSCVANPQTCAHPAAAYIRSVAPAH